VNDPQSGHQLSRALEESFSSFGRAVENQLSWVRWRVELPTSKIYPLLGLLVFSNPRQPEDELVVITGKLRTEPEPQWDIDAIDAQAVIFSEINWAASGSDRLQGASDERAIRVRITSYLDSILPEVLKKLATAIKKGT
jgi:hypothetical protein